MNETYVIDGHHASHFTSAVIDGLHLFHHDKAFHATEKKLDISSTVPYIGTN
jgi:hypothetical protein